MATTTFGGPSSTERSPDTTVAPTRVLETAPPARTVDVSGLPDLRASHVAVYGRGEVQFLDVETGVWSAVPLASGVAGMRTLDNGLVLTSPSGAVVFASPTSDQLTRFADEEESALVDVSNGLVVFGSRSERQTVRARTPNGVLVWRVGLRDGARAVGLLDDGRLVLQVAEWVAALTVESGDVSMLTAGRVVGVLGDNIFVTACTDDLDCGIDKINAVTGERGRLLDGSVGVTQSIGDYLLIYLSSREGMVRLRVSEGAIVVAEPEEPDFRCLADLRMYDAAGAMVQVCRDRIEFYDASAQLVAEVPVPFDQCCGGIALIGDAAGG